MKFFARKQSQRLTNYALAALLVFSTITASVPFIFSETANAAVDYNLSASLRCEDGAVVFDVLGNNPGASDVYVKAEAAGERSATPVLAKSNSTDVEVPLVTTQASVEAGYVTIYYSATEDGTYGLLDDNESARASHTAYNCVAPDAPTDLLPANNSFTNNPSFDNSWNAVAGAVKYEYTTSYVYAGNNKTYTDTSDAGNYVLGDATIVRQNNGAPEATYSWKVRGINANGVAGRWSATQDVTVDTTLPAVSITSPTVNQLVGGTTLTIEGIATDAQAFNYYYCYVTLPGSSEVGTRSAACNTTFGSSNGGVLGTVDLSGLPNGNYEAHLVGYDRAGNHSDLNYVVPFALDSSKPVIYVKAGGVNVLPSSLASNTFKTVSFTVYDKLKVDKVTINGVVKDLTNAQWPDVNGVTKGVFGAVEGANTIVLFDTAGNTTSYDFIIDTIAPEAPGVSATGITTSGASTNQPYVTINWNTPTGAVKYDYKVWTDISTSRYNTEADAYIEKGLTSNSRTGGFSEGEGSYFIQLRAIDAAGNESPWSSTFTVIYDATAPTVSVDAPTATVTNQPTITGKTSSDTSTVTVTIYEADGTTFVETGTATYVLGETTFSYDVQTVLVYGATYVVKASATDLAGNTTDAADVATRSMTVEAAPVTPVVSTTPPPTAPESTDDEPTTAPTNAALASVFAPAFTSPAAAAVLGTTDQTPETGVEGISDEKVAAAVNSEANQGTIFGIAWFWWILIIAALSALAWFIIGAIRRRNEANS